MYFSCIISIKKEDNPPTCHSSYSLTSEQWFAGTDTIWKYGIVSKSSQTTYFERNKFHAPQCKVLPRLELGSLDSKSKVLTIAPQGPILIVIWVWSLLKKSVMKS